MIPGIKKTVQPVCKCEAEAKAKELQAMEKFQERKESERRFSLSKLGARFKEDTFENFTVRKGSEQALRAAEMFVLNFSKDTEMGLYLWGGPGNGKTKLAGAIVNALSNKGNFVIYEKTTKLLQRIREAFNKDSNYTQSDVMKDLRLCDLLVLDDIAAENVTGWVEETLFRIVDMRYEDKKPVIFTSNVPASKLHEIMGERIQDRIYEMCDLVKNSATSYRRELAEKRMGGAR